MKEQDGSLPASAGQLTIVVKRCGYPALCLLASIQLV